MICCHLPILVLLVLCGNAAAGTVCDEPLCENDQCGPSGCPPRDGLGVGVGIAGPRGGWVGAGVGILRPQRKPQVNQYLVQLKASRGDQSSNVGNGIVIGVNRQDGSRGAILTVAHLFLGVTSIEITFSDGAKATGTIAAADAQSDVALIEFTDPHQSWFRVPIATAEVQVGEPIQWQAWTYSVIGGQQRWAGSGGSGQVVKRYGVTVEITAQPLWDLGNSGGAVLDGEGHLIGLISARDDSHGYTQPVSKVLEFVRQHAAWAITDQADRQRLGLDYQTQPTHPLLSSPPLNLIPVPRVILPGPADDEPVEELEADESPAKPQPEPPVPTVPPMTPVVAAVDADEEPTQSGPDWGGLLFGAASTVAPWILGALGISTGAAVPVAGIWLAAKVGSAILQRRRRKKAARQQSASSIPIQETGQASVVEGNQQRLILGWSDPIKQQRNRYVRIEQTDMLGAAYQEAIAKFAEANPNAAGLLKLVDQLADNIHAGMRTSARMQAKAIDEPLITPEV